MAKIVLSLLAPYNEAAMLLGDFNDWQPQAMQKDQQGVFRLELELADGVYHYRFCLPSLSWFNEPGSWVEIIDPWAQQVNSEAQAAVLRIEQGQICSAPYSWQDAETEQLPLSELVLYELHIGQFAATPEGLGGYAEVTARLDHLQQLGVNGIQLMPVSEFVTEVSMGYNPGYFFAPEASYGPPEALKALIDSCHQRQIRVIADMIFNHVAPECPLTQIDHDYWFRREPKDPDYHWGPEFDYEKVDEHHQRRPAWEFAQEVVWYWLQEYHFDGIRFDAVKQIAQRDFLRWIVAEAQQAAGPKPFLNIAECIPDRPEVVCGPGAMDACWHDSFCHIMREILVECKWNPEGIKNAIAAHRRGYTSPMQLIHYLSNHDQPRLLRALQDAGWEAQAAWQRLKLGVYLLMSSWGIPMLRMGDEWGETRESLKHLHWEALESEAGQQLFHLHRELLALRRAHAALKLGEVSFVAEAEQGLIFLRQWEDDQVLVALNFSAEQPVQLPLQLEGQWQQFQSEACWQAGEHLLELGPSEALLLVRQSAASEVHSPEAAEAQTAG